MARRGSIVRASLRRHSHYTLTKPRERAVSSHAYRAGRHLEIRRDIGRVLLRIKGQYEQRPIARRQRVQTMLDAHGVERLVSGLDDARAVAKYIHQVIPSLSHAAQIRRDHAARSQDE